MRNWPRYSRGSFEAEEMTRPWRKKIFFSTRLFEMTSVPVFCPRLSHCSKSPGSIVLRLPERAIEGTGIICSVPMSSDRPVFYSESDLQQRHFDSARDLAEPGQFPYT